MRLPRLFRRADSAPEQKQSRAAAAAVVTPGFARWTSFNFQAFAHEAYGVNVVANQCISKIASAVASVDWKVYRGESLLSEHPVIDMLRNPNPRQSGPEYLRAKVSFLKIAGNSYEEVVSASDSGPIELYQLRPDWMTIALDKAGDVLRYEYGPSGRKVVFAGADLDSIRHLREFNPLDQVYGQSPVQAAMRAIDTHNEAQAWLKALLENAARPSGMLQTPPDTRLTDEQFHRLRAELESTHQGSRNAGRPMIVEGGLTWQATGMTPVDMELIETKNAAARDIALAFGVPPQLLGIPGDNTYSNYQEARLAFWEDTVIPLVQMIETDWNRGIAKPRGVTIYHDADKIPAMADRRARQWEMAKVAQGMMTINEQRGIMGEDPIDGGDVVLVDQSLMPLDQLMELGGPILTGAAKGATGIDPQEAVKAYGKPSE